MDTPPNGFELSVIMCRERGVASLLQFANAQLNRCFIDADYVVMLVHLDVQRSTNRYHEMLLIQLCIPLYCFVLDVFRDVAQLGQSLVSQFMMCVSHGLACTFRLKPA